MTERKEKPKEPSLGGLAVPLSPGRPEALEAAAATPRTPERGRPRPSSSPRRLTAPARLQFAHKRTRRSTASVPRGISKLPGRGGTTEATGGSAPEKRRTPGRRVGRQPATREGDQTNRGTQEGAAPPAGTPGSRAPPAARARLSPAGGRGVKGRPQTLRAHWLADGRAGAGGGSGPAAAASAEPWGRRLLTGVWESGHQHTLQPEPRGREAEREAGSMQGA
ncbi:collagen alpha-1(III) chain-like [Vulpes lagopus]|uniref:collagen alpha-1(III) chain-like n=1 Tax=Vulpes lagopus TaxID=494514 RepID=UPI001BC9A8F2|nr:collagen alpha-1(III) chain-like [Vulpes lagopus]